MSQVDILEWIMGWAWPIIGGLGIVMIWGIVRFIAWDKDSRTDECSSGTAMNDSCNCECRP